MFKLAVKDSLSFAKKHFPIFILFVFCQIGLRYIGFGSEFSEMSNADFISYPAMALYLYMLVFAAIFLCYWCCFDLFKHNKKINFVNFKQEFLTRGLSAVMFCLFVVLFIAMTALLYSFFVFMGWLFEIKMYEIYNYFLVESGVFFILLAGYVFSYICLKLFFGLAFALQDKDMFVMGSLKKSFSLINYKEILKVVIAILAYFLVIGSLGEFVAVITELFMSKQSIAFFKFHEFNFFGFLYLFVNGVVAILMLTFVTSYGWQFHQKFLESNSS